MRATVTLGPQSTLAAVTCALCGSVCGTRAVSKPDHRRRSAIVDCPTCTASYRLDLQVITLNKGTLPKGKPTPAAKCGTNSGYVRHMQQKEVPCAACKRAHAAYQQTYRKGAT